MIPPSSLGALPQNADVLYTINSPVNGTGASLKGVEIALQTTFRSCLAS